MQEKTTHLNNGMKCWNQIHNPSQNSGNSCMGKHPLWTGQNTIIRIWRPCLQQTSQPDQILSNDLWRWETRRRVLFPWKAWEHHNITATSQWQHIVYNCGLVPVGNKVSKVRVSSLLSGSRTNTGSWDLNIIVRTDALRTKASYNNNIKYYPTSIFCVLSKAAVGWAYTNQCKSLVKCFQLKKWTHQNLLGFPIQGMLRAACCSKLFAVKSLS